MQPVGPTWYAYFTKAVDEKKMTLEKALEFVREFSAEQPKEALDKLESFSK